jgi:hypothetical protein
MIMTVAPNNSIGNDEKVINRGKIWRNFAASHGRTEKHHVQIRSG